jgi:hypothetical protein
MSDDVRMWVEIGFNLTYLIVIWWLVITMTSKRSLVSLESDRLSKLVIWTFGLLAIGDTGHVGFRVLAYVAISFLAYDDLYPRYQEHTLQN